MNKPLRIGFVVSSTRNGGAEDVVLRWAAEVAARGHAAFVYTFLPHEVGDVDDRVVHVHRDFARALHRWVRLPGWLRARARQDRLDVLISALTHANLVALIGLATVRPSRTRVIITEHSLPSRVLPLDGRGSRVKLWLVDRLYRRADAAVAVSHAVAAELAGRWSVPFDRIAVVPNPVLDLPPARLPVLPGSLHLLFVGRLVPQKSPHRFVETLASLAGLGIDVRGTVVGAGPLQKGVEQAAVAAGVVVSFTGWQSDWTTSADAYDCLVLPSSVEGFGNVLVEAAAAGIPCVAPSTALGVADAIVPGVTGELAAAATGRALAAAVLRAVAAREDDPVGSWLRRFTPQSSADALLDAVHQAVGRAAAASLDASAAISAPRARTT